MPRDIRILSLDGGGIWALIQLKALGAIYGYDTAGTAILRRFDFAFANSGGSIVLAGLMIDKTPREILPFFTHPATANAMFDRKPLFKLRRFVRFVPRYRTSSKARVLFENFGMGMLKTVDHPDGHQTYVAIVGFDYDRERAFFFRSVPSLRTHATDVMLAAAVHASSTAPVRYYDAPAEVGVTVRPSEHQEVMHFWDGAVTGLNNPVAAAVAEALSVGMAADRIAALSIGTGNVVLPNTRTGHTADPAYVIGPARRGLFAAIAKLAGSVIGDPPDFASFLAHASLGGRTPPSDSGPPIEAGAVVRMNPLVTPVWDVGRSRWDAPAGFKAEDFKRLINFELDATEPDEVALIENFADAWVEGGIINQPIRFHFRDPTRGIVAEIGHLDFGAALARWDVLDPEARLMRG